MSAMTKALAVALVVVCGGAIHLWRLSEEKSQRITYMQSQLDAFTSATGAAAYSGREGAGASALPVAEPMSTVPAEGAALPSGQVGALAQEGAAPKDAARSEMQERIFSQYRALLPMQYPDIDKELNLSTQELSQLFDLMSQQAMRRRSGSSPPLAGQDALQAYTRQMQENEAEVASLLGSKYPRWQAYNKELPMRQQMRDLTAALDAQGLQLREGQSAPLLAELIAVQEQMELYSTPTSQPYGPQLAPRYTEESTQRFVAAASPYLTPQQLTAYQQLLNRLASSERRSLRTMQEALKIGEKSIQ
jgi:hypothetical protein